MADASPNFSVFYATYAPKLWGLILTAKLPKTQSAAILINTITKGWKQLDQKKSNQQHILSWLIGLAYEEGLPKDCLAHFFRTKK
ncbi:hypothetical protein IC229_34535 [Spirosoma sp. BT702]|uniref:Uncharacterized protein n=1 Tax=Spirosoma profusum TaxID=2771354 RepID=A0A927GAY7_9BACT|nr:hypothetical protein [Spirosoma profusum]MBD2705773.1 hypothetical protein [Spirosoma profusum]